MWLWNMLTVQFDFSPVTEISVITGVSGTKSDVGIALLRVSTCWPPTWRQQEFWYQWACKLVDSLLPLCFFRWINLPVPVTVGSRVTVMADLTSTPEGWRGRGAMSLKIKIKKTLLPTKTCTTLRHRVLYFPCCLIHQPVNLLYQTTPSVLALPLFSSPWQSSSLFVQVRLSLFLTV